MKIDHYAIQVSDLDAAIRFYVDTFGLKLQFSALDEQAHEAFAFLELDGGKLELLQQLTEANQPQPYAPPAPQPPYCPHLALQTDDMDGTLALIKERGLSLIHGPLEAPKVRWLYLSDPDHNVIEIVQWEINPAEWNEG